MAAAVITDKKTICIEKLLQWCFLDELPKRALNANGESWDRLTQYGFLGGVDIDEPIASVQRYAYVGEPHRDALTIERAVAALGRVTVDWDADFNLIAAELAPLVNINDVHDRLNRRLAAVEHPDQAYIETPADGLGLTARIDRDRPRDLILVGSINLSALVHMHAIKRTRPAWQSEAPAPYPVPASRGKGFAVVGECRGHHFYTTGSYCPLRYSPSPAAIILQRADYLLWHRALVKLSETLLLSEHQALTLEAVATPWISGEIVHCAFKQEPDPKTFSLRDIPRPPAGPPPKKPRNSKVRIIPLDEGAKA